MLKRLMVSIPFLALFIACSSTSPASKSCAFEDSETKKCVVAYACEPGQAEMCEEVVNYLKTRTHTLAAAPAKPTNLVCDNSTIMCTCCSVKAGCYPCPKPVVK